MGPTCATHVLEAPEHIGRGERHGGIIKSAMKAVIREHNVIGKDQMKQVAIIAMEGKSDTNDQR